MTTHERFKAMTGKQKMDLFRKLDKAVGELERAGWQKIASILTDDRDGGIIFGRGADRFTLNMDTYKNLPR